MSNIKIALSFDEELKKIAASVTDEEDSIARKNAPPSALVRNIGLAGALSAGGLKSLEVLSKGKFKATIPTAILGLGGAGTSLYGVGLGVKEYKDEQKNKAAIQKAKDERETSAVEKAVSMAISNKYGKKQ